MNEIFEPYNKILMFLPEFEGRIFARSWMDSNFFSVKISIKNSFWQS
jgi:hypothetical protein